jgi:hypothetical protein
MGFKGEVEFKHGTGADLKEIHAHYQEKGWRAYGVDKPTNLPLMYPESTGIIVMHESGKKGVIGFVEYHYLGRGGVHIDAIGVKEGYGGFTGTHLMTRAEEMIKLRRTAQGMKTAYITLVPSIRALRSKAGRMGSVQDPQKVRVKWFSGHGYVQKEERGQMVKLFRKFRKSK